MRVIAGAHRGAKLRAPRGERTRPTSDRVREAVFSMLADVHDERVLDLFAGSGALAIEALSRGAASATLVDSSTAATEAIAGNLKALGLQAEVQRRDALAFLAAAREAGRQYDLVFVDPPYRLAGMVGRELSIALAWLLAPESRVVTESDRRAPLELELPLVRERRYGDTLIRIHDPR
ncbi:MAG: 16S rRNA (guanine(966)-N(2))-methyltransferase RsmD [Solirubrobacteraceae bacterium]|jgi:16S rRNA (guanine966-N2)-methyltransferase